MRRARDFGVGPDRRSALAGAGAFALAGCGGGPPEDRHDFGIRSTIHATYGRRPVQGSAVQSRRMELGRRNRTFGEASTALKDDVQRPTTLLGKRFAFDRWEIERIAREGVTPNGIERHLPWVDPAHRYWEGRAFNTLREPKSILEQDAMAARGVDMKAYR